jgi:hypothetical protein
LCAALKDMQHDVCPNVVAKLLRKLGYSLQSNRKTREGSKHPDRDAQFQYLDARMKEHMAEQSPVISVDTKKKELVGDFKNGGRELRPKASPEEVRVHDFIDRVELTALWHLRCRRQRGWVAWITIPRRPRSMRSAAGGARWDRPAIHEPGG